MITTKLPPNLYVLGAFRTTKDAANRALRITPKNSMPYREKYYRAINVDAFSSDAIPVHLITKQAIEMYMSKLRDDGVLCVHTSNRHMNLVRPVARIAMELNEANDAGARSARTWRPFPDQASSARTGPPANGSWAISPPST